MTNPEERRRQNSARAEAIMEHAVRLWYDDPARIRTLDRIKDREIVIEVIEEHRADIESLRNDMYLTAMCRLEDKEDT